MRSALALVAFSSAVLTLASPWGRPHGPKYGGHKPSKNSEWSLKRFETLVVFGDSYSDDSRLGYFINNDGEAPPVGYENPVVSLDQHHLLL